MTGDPRKYLEKIIQVTLMEIVTMRYVCVRFGDVYLRCRCVFFHRLVMRFDLFRMNVTEGIEFLFRFDLLNFVCVFNFTADGGTSE